MDFFDNISLGIVRPSEEPPFFPRRDDGTEQGDIKEDIRGKEVGVWPGDNLHSKDGMFIVAAKI